MSDIVAILLTVLGILVVSIVSWFWPDLFSWGMLIIFLAYLVFLYRRWEGIK